MANYEDEHNPPQHGAGTAVTGSRSPVCDYLMIQQHSELDDSRAGIPIGIKEEVARITVVDNPVIRIDRSQSDVLEGVRCEDACGQAEDT